MELIKIFKNKENEFKIFFKANNIVQEYSIERKENYKYHDFFSQNICKLYSDKYNIPTNYSLTYIEKTKEYCLTINNYKNKKFEQNKEEIEKYLNSLKLEKKSYKEIELYEFLFSKEYENLKNSKSFLNSNKYYVKKMWNELLK